MCEFRIRPATGTTSGWGAMCAVLQHFRSVTYGTVGAGITQGHTLGLRSARVCGGREDGCLAGTPRQWSEPTGSESTTSCTVSPCAAMP